MAASYRYQSFTTSTGGFIVAAQHTNHPDWLQVVARFVTEVRAKTYATWLNSVLENGGEATSDLRDPPADVSALTEGSESPFLALIDMAIALANLKTEFKEYRELIRADIATALAAAAAGRVEEVAEPRAPIVPNQPLPLSAGEYIEACQAIADGVTYGDLHRLHPKVTIQQFRRLVRTVRDRQKIGRAPQGMVVVRNDTIAAEPPVVTMEPADLAVEEKIREILSPPPVPPEPTTEPPVTESISSLVERIASSVVTAAPTVAPTEVPISVAGTMAPFAETVSSSLMKVFTAAHHVARGMSKMPFTLIGLRKETKKYGIPDGSVYAHVSTLASRGYFHHIESGLYELTGKMPPGFELGISEVAVTTAPFVSIETTAPAFQRAASGRAVEAQVSVRPKLGTPVQRRCQLPGCNHRFTAFYVDEINCPDHELDDIMSAKHAAAR